MIGSRGFADSSLHPLCYISVSSEAVALPKQLFLSSIKSRLTDNSNTQNNVAISNSNDPYNKILYDNLYTKTSVENNIDSQSRNTDQQIPYWSGSLFNHGPEYNPHTKILPYAYDRVIYPTRKMYQTGVNSGGACKLAHDWTACRALEEGDFCYETSNHNRPQIWHNFHGS